LDGLDKSIEDEKDKNEFLYGLPAVYEALKTKKIECRVFDKSKFHAKAFITHFRKKSSHDVLLNHWWIIF